MILIFNKKCCLYALWHLFKDMAILKTNNPEFDNLLRLLSSTDEASVRLGLQLAYCCPI
jgi:hypothetical protein